MKNIFNPLFFILSLTLLVFGCKKEAATPQNEPVIFDDATLVAQDQDAIGQLFLVASYAQAIGAATAQNQNFMMSCGTATFPTDCPVGTEGCVDINFPNCILPSGLKLNGTLRFETYSSTNPSANNPVKTHLVFSTFAINDRVITMPPNTFIRFQDIADPVAGYDLFEVFSSADVITVDNITNTNTTEYLPFQRTNFTDPDPVHIKLRIEPSLDVDFNVNTSPADFLAALLDKTYTMKLEKRPGSPTPSNNSTDLWQAVTRDASNSVIQQLHLITTARATIPTGEENDILGLQFKLNPGCAHFTHGKLEMRKRADIGCYYNYRDYDFGYVEGGDETCADQTGNACDDFILLTEYTAGCNQVGFAATGQCTNIDNLCGPECRAVQCF